MRAFVFDKYKSPLHEAQVPEPTVGERDVLVRVVAAGVNQLDEKIREGEFKAILPYKTPLTLGHDVAGTVISVGQQGATGSSLAIRCTPVRGITASALLLNASRSTRPISPSRPPRSALSRRHRCRWWP